MTTWQVGQGPDADARWCGTVRRAPQAGQRNDMVSGKLTRRIFEGKGDESQCCPGCGWMAAGGGVLIMRDKDSGVCVEPFGRGFIFILWNH